MNKKSLLWLMMLVICINLAYALDFEVNYTILEKGDYITASPFYNLQVRDLMYDPYPANPGEYLTLWIKVENTGSHTTDNATFELVPEYPFSLEPGESAIKAYGKLYSDPIVLKYKVRVDKDAVKGTNEIKLKYSANGKDPDWGIKTFDIEVDTAQTDFDLIVQEINQNEVSIAIANIGENTAKSVIVKIPDQDYYEASGTNGQMIGNLEAGDYTLVSFDLARKPGIKMPADNPLKIEVDYTDNIGERRSLIKDISLKLGGNGGNSTLTGNGNYSSSSAFRNGTKTATLSIYQQWWFWAIIIAVAYSLWRGYSFYQRRKERMDEKRVRAKKNEA